MSRRHCAEALQFRWQDSERSDLGGIAAKSHRMNGLYVFVSPHNLEVVGSNPTPIIMGGEREYLEALSLFSAISAKQRASSVSGRAVGEIVNAPPRRSLIGSVL